MGGVTPENILRHKPVTRNPALAEMFQKLGLVETAGIGFRRIFIPMLSFGKRSPRHEKEGRSVVLRLFNGAFDERMAVLVAKWRKERRDFGLDGLLLLTYLPDRPYVDTEAAACLLQLPTEDARGVLERCCLPPNLLLERKGKKRGLTFHLTKGVARDLIGSAACSRIRGIEPLRYEEMVRRYVDDLGSITNEEYRHLLNVGDSQSAKVQVSRLLRTWSGPDAFLGKTGKPPATRYYHKSKTR